MTDRRPRSGFLELAAQRSAAPPRQAEPVRDQPGERPVRERGWSYFTVRLACGHTGVFRVAAAHAREQRALLEEAASGRCKRCRSHHASVPRRREIDGWLSPGWAARAVTAWAARIGAPSPRPVAGGREAGVEEER